MIFYDALAAVGNNQDILNPGGNSLFNDVLNGRLIHNIEHFLRHSLRSGQHARAHTRGRNNRFFTFIL